MRSSDKKRPLLAGTIIAGCLGAGLASAAELDGNALLNPALGDWPMYHGSYKSWHYSPLDQINTGNIGNLHVAFMHNPGASPHGGIQATPIAVGGRLYYTIAHDQIWAIDGATGRRSGRSSRS
jgi:alcohol dehydrogenase (cytochrome c)